MEILFYDAFYNSNNIIYVFLSLGWPYVNFNMKKRLSASLKNHDRYLIVEALPTVK